MQSRNTLRFFRATLAGCVLKLPMTPKSRNVLSVLSLRRSKLGKTRRVMDGVL